MTIDLPVPDDIALAVRTAVARGSSRRAVANVYGLSRDTVDRILDADAINSRKAAEARRRKTRVEQRKPEPAKGYRLQNGWIAVSVSLPEDEFQTIRAKAQAEGLPFGVMLRELASIGLEAEGS